MPRRVLDPRIENQSSAYLAMWNALECYNPATDRQSDPTDFGPPDDRLRRADNCIRRVEAAEKDQPLDAAITGDISRFRTEMERLTQGASFDERLAEFSEHLLDEGLRYSKLSVVTASDAGAR